MVEKSSRCLRRIVFSGYYERNVGAFSAMNRLLFLIILIISMSMPVSGMDAEVVASSGSSPSGSEEIDEAHKENVRKGLAAIIEGLKQRGMLREVPHVATQLQDAIQTKEDAVIHRTFQDVIYSPLARMNEVIPAIKTYLDSSEPYVRYSAAEALLQAGDHSGVETLLQMVQSDEPIRQGKRDLRISAAHLLAKYGVTFTESAIFDLYQRTSGSGLLSSLSQLRSTSVLDVFKKNGYHENMHSIERYGIAGNKAFGMQMETTFEQSNDPATKNAAAWALARMTKKDQYVDFLIKSARPAIERKKTGSLSYDDTTKALKYLGSIQSPQAVRVLESALESQNPVAVQYATVNLLFNQPGGSEKAEQVVLRELQNSPLILGGTLTMQIASKLDNPQIRAAAESFAKRTGSDSWGYWGVERADWPIQNWIYDYVIMLNP